MNKELSAPETEINEDDGLLIKFSKPVTFEGREYTEADLSGLADMTATDMIAVSKFVNVTSVLPETSLEYALHMAARATDLPVELFMKLSMKDTMKVKSKVTGFLFGSD